MNHDVHDRGHDGGHGGKLPGIAIQRRGTPGKQTLVEQVDAPAVQRRVNGADADSAVHDAAARGVATPASPLPFADTIQRAFGRHDISSIQAHAGGEAAASAGAMGADAYATGNHVVLGDRSDLHTVAHEAAHVVQQRGGVQLRGGVGAAGDVYEQHADQIADQVVAGRSAEPLLDHLAPGSGRAGEGGGGAVQQLVKKKRLGSKYIWYSDLDPETTFPSRKEASQHEQTLHRKVERANRPTPSIRDTEEPIEAEGTEAHDGHAESSAMVIDDGAGPAPQDAVPAPSAAGGGGLESVRAMILRCLPPRVSANHAARALVIDWTPQEIAAAEGLEFLTELDVASCFATAGRVFDLLGDPATTQGDWQAALTAGVGIPRLVGDIQANAQNAVVYRVGLNRVAHGFTIVVRHGTAEVIQGFAGPSGESLAQNIERDGSHTIEAICGLLQALVSGGDGAFGAQNTLFNGTIDIEKVPADKATKLAESRDDPTLRKAPKSEQTEVGYVLFYRDLAHDVFQLERRALFSPEVLEQKVQTKIREGLAALAAKAAATGNRERRSARQ